MVTVNSLSGGKTSSYIAKHYRADYNLFALVRIEDVNCKFPDEKVRQMVSDRIGQEFIGTPEMDTIIYTMLDLEQFIGQEITWVTGMTFEETIDYKSGYLPNKVSRYCTTLMKIVPMFEWWYHNIGDPIEMRIGFRANEMTRAKNMLEKVNEDGLSVLKHTMEKRPDGRNKWQEFPWQKPVFPLIHDRIFKDTIESYWKDQPVRFAELNNCTGCFHRNELLLKKMFDTHPNKMQWFADQENKGKTGTWKTGITYEQIKRHRSQHEIDFDDFGSCDTGYCGL